MRRRHVINAKKTVRITFSGITETLVTNYPYIYGIVSTASVNQIYYNYPWPT